MDEKGYPQSKNDKGNFIRNKKFYINSKETPAEKLAVAFDNAIRKGFEQPMLDKRYLQECEHFLKRK